MTLDQLLVAIKEEAARIDVIEPVPVQSKNQQLTHAINLLHPRLRDSKCEKLGQLLTLDGMAFMQSAYTSILGRAIDQDGIDGYLPLLRSSNKKLKIIKSLQKSDEAIKSGLKLKTPLFWQFYLWLPESGLIGRLVSAFEPLYQAMLLLPHKFKLLFHTYDENDLYQMQEKSYLAFNLIKEDLEEKVDFLGNEIAALRGQINYLQQTRAIDASSVVAESVSDQVADPVAMQAFYVAFEDECRGDQDVIQNSQINWLKFVPDTLNSNKALDIGCGRGEWLDLLRQKGFKVKGLEANAVMQKVCKEKGLDVSCEEVVLWLKAQEENSLSVVTAFHVLEHVAFSLVLSWVTEIYRVLEPGGVIIFETPNPENVLVGSHTFYHDPTHRNPLTPTLMSFLARYVGFARVEIVRLHPYPDSARVSGSDELTERVNGHLCGPQDFGLVAYKPG